MNKKNIALLVISFFATHDHIQSAERSYSDFQPAEQMTCLKCKKHLSKNENYSYVDCCKSFFHAECLHFEHLNINSICTYCKKAIGAILSHKKTDRTVIVSQPTQACPDHPNAACGCMSSENAVVDEALQLEECTVCKELLLPEQANELTVTSCGHSFHHPCLARSLQHAPGKCPLCRTPVPSYSSQTETDFYEKDRKDQEEGKRRKLRIQSKLEKMSRERRAEEAKETEEALQLVKALIASEKEEEKRAAKAQLMVTGAQPVAAQERLERERLERERLERERLERERLERRLERESIITRHRTIITVATFFITGIIFYKTFKK